MPRPLGSKNQHKRIDAGARRINKYIGRTCALVVCCNLMLIRASKLKHSRGKYCSPICTVDARRDPDAKWNSLAHVKNYNQRYRDSNRAALNSAARRRNERKPELARGRRKRWRDNHVESVRAAARNRRGRPGKHSVAEWFLLLLLTGFRCLKCGSLDRLTADHVVPVALGGTSFIFNIQPLCEQCNKRKMKTATDYRPQIVRRLFCEA